MNYHVINVLEDILDQQIICLGLFIAYISRSKESLLPLKLTCDTS